MTRLNDHEAARPVATAKWLDDDDHDDDDQVEVVQHADSVESFIDIGQWLSHQIETARDTTAAPGRRLGPTPEPTYRTGTREEVVAPLALRPRVALEAITRGALFDPPIDSLSIAMETFENRGLSCSWQATVRTNVYRTRRATLRIGPSRSGNLTVLQLIPLRAKRFHTTTFVEVGVPALQGLGERLISRANVASPTKT